jgi:hydrogenase maturation protease
LIAYGNTLRGDDGVAAAIAAEVSRSWGSTELEIRVVLQLVPELALELSGRDFVIFVDACVAAPAGSVALSPVGTTDPEALSPTFTHHVSPERLLVLSSLYGTVPRASLLTVGIRDLGHREGLSASAESAVPAAVRLITGVIQENLDHPLLPECVKVQSTGE